MGMTPQYARLRTRLRSIAARDSWYIHRGDKQAIADADRVIGALIARIEKLNARSVFLSEGARLPAYGSTRAPLPAEDVAREG